MGYNKKIYAEAKEILKQRVNNAQNAVLKNTAEVYERIPEIRAIDNKLANTASKLASVLISSKADIEKNIDDIKKENLALQSERERLLTASGYPADYTAIKHYCTKCSDSGYIGEKMCICLHTELARIALEQSGIGKLADTQSFESFDLKYYINTPSTLKNMKSNLDFLNNYADTFNSDSKNLLLIGKTGLGKTHLSTACAKVIINNGYDVVYDSAQNILSDFEYERFGREYNTDVEEKRTDKYFNCDLLIIDDMGTEIINNFIISTFYNLINTRINSKKPIIISTNLIPKELRERYDSRITSRLFGEFVSLMFEGIDIRLQKLK